MNVTPSNKLLHVMQHLTDAVCGAEPSKLMVGPTAQKTRDTRRMMMDVLHGIVAQSMREGVNRKVKELLDARGAQHAVYDKDDHEARARAADDAESGRPLIQLPR